jgi:amidase
MIATNKTMSKHVYIASLVSRKYFDMNRRLFLKNGSVASLSIGAIAVASCQQPSSTSPTALPGAVETATTDAFELNEVTISDLQQKMEKGEMTSKAMTELYLKRIEAIDKSGPTLRSVIEVNPDAIGIAEQMDKERKDGKVRGPMHGIPILIKDNIDTADKMMTTAGSIALEENIATKDAFVVQRLRAAGAVILGKTNLSEWANFRSSSSSSGWSSRGGQTKNPCILDRNPCGSSSGSGAAVAANLCAVAVGTETDGSVIAPASQNGIVGMKPTVGLVSRSGIIPISATQDTAGPMARTVADAAILLSAMTGIDEADGVTKTSEGKVQTDYTKFLDANALSGKRIGYEKNMLKGHDGVVNLYKAAIETLKAKGAILEEVELQKETRPLGDAEYDVLKYEFKDGLNKYLSQAKGKVKSLAELIAFNKANADKAMPFFSQDILEASEEMKGLDSKEYSDALKKSLSAKKIIDNMLQSKKLNAIIGVSIGFSCITDLINGDYSTGFYFCPPAAMAGYPHITVPMGDVHDLPVGLSFISTAYDEPGIIALAYAFEQASKKRKAPSFKASFQPA